jgi:DNA polymerase III subunit delta'
VTRFTDILGQDSAIRMLREAVASGRVHHALLFSGPRGVGKRATADALVARIFCERPQDDACGSCDECVRLGHGTHPDRHVVEPGGDAESARRRSKTISIDQVRELQIALGRRPFVASRRMAIVDDAESMTVPAQNALLKTLEEPPGSALLVLVTENPAALTATVRSRCQRVSFRPLSTEAITTALARSASVSAADARFLAEHAAGSFGRALTIDPAKLRESLAAVERLLGRVAEEGYAAIPSSARELLELEERAGSDGGGGLQLLAGELRARLRRRAGELTPQGKTASVADELRALEAVIRAIDDLKHNANKSLTVERMLAGVAEARS